MNAPKKRAVRNLFRTFLRLTNDVERAARCTPSGKPAVAALLARHTQKSHVVGKQFMTVTDIKSHIRESFRQQSLKEEELKERISNGIQGMRQMELFLKDLQSQDLAGKQATAVSLNTLSSIDDSWVGPYVEKVKWLSNLDDEYSHGTAQANQTENAQERVELPMFPLTGPFFTPNLPLELFTSYSYWEFPTPGAEIRLKIFEPRYRELYTHLITLPASHRRFVVPFAHPFQPATYAQYGLLYQITNWHEIADETNGVFQYDCQHVVTYPVQFHRVCNPRAHQSQDTYLRVEGKIEMDQGVNELDVAAQKQIEEALMQHVEVSVATKCRDALRTEGLWGFMRCWNTSLQQRLLQIELQIAALVKKELKKHGKDAPSEKVKELVENVQNHWRSELLGLKLDLALSIPLVLQSQSCQGRLKLILELITAQHNK